MLTNHAAISTEVTSRLHELTTLVQGTPFTEVLNQLKELGISVTDVRGLIVEENKSNGTSYATLSEMHKVEYSFY